MWTPTALASEARPWHSRAWRVVEDQRVASTMKLVTTYAALEMLGPAYTWRTRAWAAGPVRDLVLDGNLVLEGGGDPFMTADRWWGFVNGLRQAGIERLDDVGRKAALRYSLERGGRSGRRRSTATCRSTTSCSRSMARNTSLQSRFPVPGVPPGPWPTASPAIPTA